MVGLFDFDSIVFASVYKIVDFGEIRGWFLDGRDRQWMETEITHLAVNRAVQISGQILNAIEDTGIDITSTEYFLTNNYHSARREKYPEYKANRSKSKNELRKWANMVRQYMCRSMHFAIQSVKWEADDLVADRAREIGAEKCVVISMDKDLRQVPGIRFDVYKRCVFHNYCEFPRKEVTDRRIYQGHNYKYVQNAKLMTNNFGQNEKDYRGLEIITHREAERNFWIQVIGGDVQDNIKGAKGYSLEKAADMLLDVPQEELRKMSEHVFFLAELKALKTVLNKGPESKRWKKLNFEKFYLYFHSDDWDEKDGNTADLIKRANEKFELNYFLIKLGVRN